MLVTANYIQAAPLALLSFGNSLLPGDQDQDILEDCWTTTDPWMEHLSPVDVGILNSPEAVGKEIICYRSYAMEYRVSHLCLFNVY